MFGLSDLRKSRYYQEVEADLRVDLRDEVTAQVRDEVTAQVRDEVKLEAIPRLVALGLTLQQIGKALELDPEIIRSTLESSPSQD